MSEGKLNIYEVLEHLREKRRYFSSEADFQLALAMQIEKDYGENSVICEYVPEYVSKFEKVDDVVIESPRIHIDILFLNENIPIELKYRTKKAELTEKLDEKEYKFNLTDQYARDEGSYGFWRDVCRIGEYQRKTKATKGYVIFLTNDEWYKNPDYNKCNNPDYYKEFKLETEYKRTFWNNFKKR